MLEKVAKLLLRLKEVEHSLSEIDPQQGRREYLALSQEHKHLTSLQEIFTLYQRSKKELEENEKILKEETDPEMQEMIGEENLHLEQEIKRLHKELEWLVVPPDPNDHRSTIMEVRAGTGGDEAALFVGDCIRMYKNYAALKGWTFESLSSTPSDAGGFKEYHFVLSGENVYRFLKHEGGTHRVQRVPETESQGRVHTSAITVAVIMEPDEEEDVEIEEKDLRVDTYRASGAGGQHVNTTDSAVRMTHIPTGVIVCCQDERSQIKNRAKAKRLLRAKIAEKKREEDAAKTSSLRSMQVGSGDRSERIRTYNFPQNRITDHRISLTLYHLDRFMEGDLDMIINPLVTHAYEKALNSGG